MITDTDIDLTIERIEVDAILRLLAEAIPLLRHQLQDEAHP